MVEGVRPPEVAKCLSEAAARTGITVITLRRYRLEARSKVRGVRGREPLQAVTTAGGSGRLWQAKFHRKLWEVGDLLVGT